MLRPAAHVLFVTCLLVLDTRAFPIHPPDNVDVLLGVSLSAFPASHRRDVTEAPVPPLGHEKLALNVGRHPWDETTLLYHSLIRLDNGTQLLYYDACPRQNRTFTPVRFTCLAVSHDSGQTWETPLLSSIPYAEGKGRGGKVHRRTNIVWPRHAGEFHEPGASFVDPSTGEIRLLVAWKGYNIYLLRSTNGVDFAPAPGPAVMHHSDTQNAIVHLRGRAIVYRRNRRVDRDPAALRLLPRKVSPRWREIGVEVEVRRGLRGAATLSLERLPQAVLAYDSKDAPTEDLYNPGAQHYEGHVFMLPSVFRHTAGKMRGKLHVRLAHSEDGLAFRYAGGSRAAWMGDGSGTRETGEGVFQSLYISPATVHPLPPRGAMRRVGVLFGGSARGHSELSGGVFRAVLREDGFAALVADADGAQVTTRELRPPLRSGAAHGRATATFFANIDCGADDAGGCDPEARAAFEIVDAESLVPFPGRTRAESVPVAPGQDTRARVTWTHSGSKDAASSVVVPTGSDAGFRLRITLARGMRLYAVRVQWMVE